MTRDEIIAEAKRLREEEDLTYKQIAKRVGIAPGTAYCYVNYNCGLRRMGRPPKKPTRVCQKCHKLDDQLYRSGGKDICGDCLSPPFAKQSVEQFHYHQSSLHKISSGSMSKDDYIGKKSSLARALDRAIKKYKIPRVESEEWIGGVEHY